MIWLKRIIRKLHLRDVFYPLYVVTILRYQKRQQIRKFHENCEELLVLVDDVLSKNGYTYWLNYGTLLGVYRDNKFIDHDFDIDIGMYWDDREKVVDVLEKASLVLLHMLSYENSSNLEYRFVYKKTYIDINFYFVENNVATTFSPVFFKGIDYNKLQKKLPIQVERIDSPFSGLIKKSFLGRDFFIPANTKEYIIANYGENYMTPIADFDYHDYATNITLCEQYGFFYKFQPVNSEGVKKLLCI